MASIPLLYSPDHLRHAPPVEAEQARMVAYHESPERVETIYKHLAAGGLGRALLSHQPATLAELRLVHSAALLEFLQAASAAASDDSYLYPEFFPIRPVMSSLPNSLAGRMGAFCSDAYSPVGSGTWQAAIGAAGLALRGADMLLRAESVDAYALCRPPGHHAGPDFFGSYCYLNNAALAAQRLLQMGNVAVLDLDYHHGNGTQAIFWNEARVLYVSLHIDPHLDFPYFNGYAHETGGPAAPDSTLNMPLAPGIDSTDYLRALDSALAVVRAFAPASIVISMGFDAYQGDPFSAFRVDADVYPAIGSRIGALNLPTLLVQEGGYDLDQLPHLAEGLLKGYLTARKG